MILPRSQCHNSGKLCTPPNKNIDMPLRYCFFHDGITRDFEVMLEIPTALLVKNKQFISLISRSTLLDDCTSFIQVWSLFFYEKKVSPLIHISRLSLCLHLL